MYRTDYDGPTHRVYREGRSQPETTVAQWTEAVRRRLPCAHAQTLVDVGAGTGRFSVPFSERLGLRVVGVEPSKGMRSVAVQSRRVAYVAGKAEDLPVRTGACDAAFLSQVIHHLDDLDRAAAEMARVIRPGGHVLLRHSLSGRLQSVMFYDLCPTAREVDDSRLPTEERLDDAFGAAGLEKVALDTVRQQTDESLRAHYGRMKRRAISTFEFVPESEFRAALDRLRELAENEAEPQPVEEEIFLVVYAKPSA